MGQEFEYDTKRRHTEATLKLGVGSQHWQLYRLREGGGKYAFLDFELIVTKFIRSISVH